MTEITSKQRQLHFACPTSRILKITPQTDNSMGTADRRSIPSCSWRQPTPALILLLLLLGLLQSVAAFLLPSSPPTTRLLAAAPAAAAAGGVHTIGEVLPERDPTLKVTRVSVEDAEANICGYLVEAEIHGPDVKRTYEMAKKGMALNAAYPGYRKGVIPPHALQDVKVNAVTASIMDVCRVAMEMHGLENFPTNERSLRMKEPKSYQDLAKTYTVGEDLRFACEIDAVGIPGDPSTPPNNEEEEKQGQGAATPAGAAAAGFGGKKKK